MTTRRAISVVSATARLGFAAVLAACLGASACAGGPRSVAPSPSVEPTDCGVSIADCDPSQARIELDNEATVHVDVYIATERDQWRLGRVAPGARALLRVPQSAIEASMQPVRLTVIPGSRASAQAARDPRAVLTIAQPLSELVSQRWTYRQSAAVALQLQGMRRVPPFIYIPAS